MDFIDDALDGLKLYKFSTFTWLNIIKNILTKPEVYRVTWGMICEALMF